MQVRDVKKQLWMNKLEAQSLTRKAKKAGLTEAALIRSLVSGYVPREKPDDRFYEAMRQLSAIGNSMNQIARKANALGLLDAPYYKQQAEQLQRFELDVYERFMSPDKMGPPQSPETLWGEEQPRSGEPFAACGESDERRAL